MCYFKDNLIRSKLQKKLASCPWLDSNFAYLEDFAFIENKILIKCNFLKHLLKSFSSVISQMKHIGGFSSTGKSLDLKSKLKEMLCFSFVCFSASHVWICHRVHLHYVQALSRVVTLYQAPNPLWPINGRAVGLGFRKGIHMYSQTLVWHIWRLAGCFLLSFGEFSKYKHLCLKWQLCENH